MDLEAARSNTKEAWCRSPDGKRHRWVELQPDGKRPRKSCPFVGPRLSGEFQAFHPDGKRWITGHYEDGRKQGHWEQWDQRGHKTAEGEYRDDQFLGGAPVGVAAGACARVSP
jgi:antitoxin component YwqK of YwqJK toxin-antitoxin module